MSEGVIVDLMPVAMNKGADEQQQRRLRLVEVRDEHADDLIVVARTDNDLRTGMKDFEVMGVHPVGQCLQGLFRGVRSEE